MQRACPRAWTRNPPGNRLHLPDATICATWRNATSEAEENGSTRPAERVLSRGGFPSARQRRLRRRRRAIVKATAPKAIPTMGAPAGAPTASSAQKLPPACPPSWR